MSECRLLFYLHSESRKFWTPQCSLVKQRPWPNQIRMRGTESSMLNLTTSCGQRRGSTLAFRWKQAKNPLYLYSKHEVPHSFHIHHRKHTYWTLPLISLTLSRLYLSVNIAQHQKADDIVFVCVCVFVCECSNAAMFCLLLIFADRPL